MRDAWVVVLDGIGLHENDVGIRNRSRGNRERQIKGERDQDEEERFQGMHVN